LEVLRAGDEAQGVSAQVCALVKDCSLHLPDGAAPVSCHGIVGVNLKSHDDPKAHGLIGPNRTHFGSRNLITGGVRTNTPANLAAWLKNPQDWKPGSDLLDLGLSQNQINAQVAYLESLWVQNNVHSLVREPETAWQNASAFALLLSLVPLTVIPSRIIIQRATLKARWYQVTSARGSAKRIRSPL